MKTSSGESAVTPASGGGPPRLMPASEENLTRREREVLSSLAEGLDTDSVAERLSISRVTVRNHAQRILGKLGVHSRLAAVARAYREGLIGPETFPSRAPAADASALLPASPDAARMIGSKAHKQNPTARKAKEK